MAAFDRISSDDWERLAPALDARIDDLSPEQRAIAVGRAQRRAGVAKLDATDEEHLRILWDESRSCCARRSTGWSRSGSSRSRASRRAVT
jgi:hypothetical protein